MAVIPFEVVRAQELAPRAYTISPMDANAITLSNVYSTGALDINGAVPITGATGAFNTPAFTYYHSFSFFGRSANIVGALAYGVGTFQGEVSDVARQAYRSGLLDSAFRFAVNLKGGPAMSAPQFAQWKQKVLLAQA